MGHTFYTDGVYNNIYTKGLEQTQSTYVECFRSVIKKTDMLEYQAKDDAIRHIHGAIVLLIKHAASDHKKESIGIFKTSGAFAEILNVIGSLKYKNIAYIRKPMLLGRRQMLTASDYEACVKATIILRSIHDRIMSGESVVQQEDKDTYLHSAVRLFNFLLNNNDSALNAVILNYLAESANHLYARLILILFEHDAYTECANASWEYMKSVVRGLYGKNSTKAMTILSEFRKLKSRTQSGQNDFFNAFRWYLCNLFADDILQKLELNMRIRPELYDGEAGRVLRAKIQQFKSQSTHYDLFQPEEHMSFPEALNTQTTARKDSVSYTKKHKSNTEKHKNKQQSTKPQITKSQKTETDNIDDINVSDSEVMNIVL